MTMLNRIDLLLRRNSRLPKLPWLRNALRKPYHSIMAMRGSGFDLNLAGIAPITVPVEYCSSELENYEMETVQAIADWTSANRGGVFVDIGCSFGYLSCAVRFLDPDAHVIAIDADLPSLEVTRRMCRYAPRAKGSLDLILGLIGPAEKSSPTFETAVARTHAALKAANFGSGDVHTNYVVLDTQISPDSLPRMSLDELIAPDMRPVLIKCDVEGAEQSVLEGASRTLASTGVTLLVSVHPQFVARYGGSVERIRALIEDAGYAIEVVGIDHEEHWLCQRL
ncbi:MAG: FkbM family methyltransferase [Gemmatimonadales bacterium]